MQANRRRELAQRLDEAGRIIRDVSRQLKEDTSSTEAEQSLGRKLETDLVATLNANMSVLRLW